MSTADELRAVYADVPAINCKGLCHDACGPIGLTPVELQRLQRVRPNAPQRGGLCCPYLSASGRCSAYRARPLICRLWGVIEALPCHHGCTPERYLTDSEAANLMRRVDTIAGTTEREWLGDIAAIRLARERGLIRPPPRCSPARRSDE